MLLLLIRHARASARDPGRWPDDRDRPLTDEGREIHAEVGRALRRLGLEPETVLTSPWTRARQTAEITVDALRLAAKPVECEPLAAEPDLDALQEHIGPRSESAVIALVGHSPWLEELASLLLGGSTSRVQIDLPKSGVVGIECSLLAPGAGALSFLLRPKQARKLQGK
jgi:phosphohistidine phosphatase